jgi:hypothetical protein
MFGLKTVGSLTHSCTYLNLLKLAEVEEEGGEEESHAGPALTHASQLTYSTRLGT